MVYGKVFVAGGAKGVGRAVIDKLVEQGSEVVALVRREDAKAELDAIKGGSVFIESSGSLGSTWATVPTPLTPLQLYIGAPLLS